MYFENLLEIEICLRIFKIKNKIYKNKNFKAQIFLILIIHKPSLESRTRDPTKNLGRVRSAVFKYKQTNIQTDRQTSKVYIYILILFYY